VSVSITRLDRKESTMNLPTNEAQEEPIGNLIQAEVIQVGEGQWKLVLELPITTPLRPTLSGRAYMLFSTPEKWNQTTAMLNGKNVVVSQFAATIKK
jgi:hypothetical protein